MVNIHPEDNNKKMMFGLPLVMQNIHHLPFHAPHFVNMVLNSCSSLSTNIDTTLDYRTQMIIERITRHYLARKKGLGVI